MSTSARNPRKYKLFALLLAVAWSITPYAARAQEQRPEPDVKVKITVGSGSGVLWSEPQDISSRNLFYGSGGEKHQPQPGFIFVEEDREGSNPKFVVKDAQGETWKVKIGMEARPETVATRLLWAVGYTTPEEYYFPEIRVTGMQRLHRGNQWIQGEVVRNVRMKRTPGKKVGEWEWDDNPFRGKREFNALRVMMALLNNWDLKDENNAICVKEEKDAAKTMNNAGGPEAPPDTSERIYEITDLGATFGASSLAFPFSKSRGNLSAYQHSKFIVKTDAETVDFATPGRPAFVYWFFRPGAYKKRLHIQKIGRDIPREDAKWVGTLLSRLSPEQIRDAFRAAGYTQQEIDGFTAVVQARIAALAKL